MPKTVQITMTQKGFEVVAGGATDRFAELAQAIAFAHDRLDRAAELRDLSNRIE